MNRRQALPLPLFVVLSFAVHAATFRVIGRHTAAPLLAFEPPPSAQTMAGDTLEVESALQEPEEDQETSASAASAASPEAAPPTSVPGPRPATTHGHGAQSVTAAAVAPPVAVFGAVGVRYATDLATTFTRAFPQAASADAAWGHAEFGNAGTADVTLALDEDGRLASHSIAGAPSAALRAGIERTLALIGPRAFTAREATTKIRVTARITRDDVHDGLHGDVFALSGGSFVGDLGSAFFALPAVGGPGRRVDVQLRLMR